MNRPQPYSTPAKPRSSQLDLAGLFYSPTLPPPPPAIKPPTTLLKPPLTPLQPPNSPQATLTPSTPP